MQWVIKKKKRKYSNRCIDRTLSVTARNYLKFQTILT